MPALMRLERVLPKGRAERTNFHSVQFLPEWGLVDDLNAAFFEDRGFAFPGEGVFAAGAEAVVPILGDHAGNAVVTVGYEIDDGVDLRGIFRVPVVDEQVAFGAAPSQHLENARSQDGGVDDHVAEGIEIFQFQLDEISCPRNDLASGSPLLVEGGEVLEAIVGFPHDDARFLPRTVELFVVAVLVLERIFDFYELTVGVVVVEMVVAVVVVGLGDSPLVVEFVPGRGGMALDVVVVVVVVIRVYLAFQIF